MYAYIHIQIFRSQNHTYRGVGKGASAVALAICPHSPAATSFYTVACACMNIEIKTFVCAYVTYPDLIHAHTHIYICIYIYIYVYIYVYIYICVRICIYEFIYTYIYIDIYMCIYMYISIYIYVYINY